MSSDFSARLSHVGHTLSVTKMSERGIPDARIASPIGPSLLVRFFCQPHGLAQRWDESHTNRTRPYQCACSLLSAPLTRLWLWSIVENLVNSITTIVSWGSLCLVHTFSRNCICGLPCSQAHDGQFGAGSERDHTIVRHLCLQTVPFDRGANTPWVKGLYCSVVNDLFVSSAHVNLGHSKYRTCPREPGHFVGHNRSADPQRME